MIRSLRTREAHVEHDPKPVLDMSQSKLLYLLIVMNLFKLLPLILGWPSRCSSAWVLLVVSPSVLPACLT